MVRYTVKIESEYAFYFITALFCYFTVNLYFYFIFILYSFSMSFQFMQHTRKNF